jgi:hypothetical protein
MAKCSAIMRRFGVRVTVELHYVKGQTIQQVRAKSALSLTMRGKSALVAQTSRGR